jgi:hypothetical protein
MVTRYGAARPSLRRRSAAGGFRTTLLNHLDFGQTQNGVHNCRSCSVVQIRSFSGRAFEMMYPVRRGTVVVMPAQVFEVPAAAGSTWLLAVLLVPAALLIGLSIALWPRPLRIELTADALQIRGSLYGRRIARQDLDRAGARALDLSARSEFQPVLRTNGVGLPNYRVGWFRLRNHERALCFLTAPEQVVYVPTRLHFALLISVLDANAFLAALNATPN